MEKRGIQVNGLDLTIDDRPMLLKGVGIGNYMNIEHFMFGLPGTESQIRQVVERVYGAESSALFWNRFHAVYLTDADMAYWAGLGLNTLRLAINYRHFEADSNPGRYRSEGFELVDRVLEMADRHGLYIILDMHAAPGGQNPDWHSDNDTGTAQFWKHKTCRDRLISLWKALARRYKTHPRLGGYDLLNEPVPENRAVSGQLISEFYHRAAAAIRSVDREHVLFIEGDFYAQDTRNFVPLKDPQVACSVHFYPFFHTTPHQPRPSAAALMKTAFTLDDIRERLKRPVWCGETGIPLDAEEPEEMALLLQDTLSVFRKENISWSVWNGKDARAMGLIHPREDSPWMELCRKIKPVWNIGREMVSAREESEERMSGTDLDPARREEVIRDMQFRILALRQIDETARLESALKKIPFADLLKALESFRFDRCEIHHGMERALRTS